MSRRERDDLDLAIDRVAARMVTAAGEGRSAARLVATLPERPPRPAWRAWALPLAALSVAAVLSVAASLRWNRPAPPVEMATAVTLAPLPVENLGENPREEPRVAPGEELRVAPRENPREEPRVAPRENPREEPRVAPRENPREEPRVAPREEPRVELLALSVPSVLLLDALICRSLDLDPVDVAPLIVEALPMASGPLPDQKE